MFVPVEIEGRMLVDGFLAAPVPVNALRVMGADIVIAVFLEAAANRKPSSIVDVIGTVVCDPAAARGPGMAARRRTLLSSRW